MKKRTKAEQLKTMKDSIHQRACEVTKQVTSDTCSPTTEAYGARARQMGRQTTAKKKENKEEEKKKKKKKKKKKEATGRKISAAAKGMARLMWRSSGEWLPPCAEAALTTRSTQCSQRRANRAT